MQSCVRPVCAAQRPLAMMVSADEVPICLAGYDALDIPWVVLASGLTGSPSLHIVLVHLKDVFGQVEADGGNLHLGWLPMLRLS